MKMRAYRIEILQPAWDDLAEIADYYVLQFGIVSAKNVTDAILDSLEVLKEFPLSYHYVPDEQLKSEGYRKVISGKFVAIYRLIDDIIYVYHIAHMASDYPKLFQ